MTALAGEAIRPLAPWIARQLQIVRAHTGPWLLQGPAGLGQFELGLQLARAWLCDRPTPEGACGRCASCHEIDVHTHPDLLVLLPDSERESLGWTLSEGTHGGSEAKKSKPSREIRIDAMRAAVEFAQRTSSRGRSRVIFIYPAERMNAVTANALLKTLEEPAGDVRFILCTDAVHALLPTIRSRCLGHTMDWPDAGEAVAWLADQGCAPADAAVALRLAGDRPGEALRLLADVEELKRYARFPALLYQGDVSALSGLPLAEAVQRSQKLCHDLLLERIGAKPRFFTDDELKGPRPPLRKLGRWWLQLSQLARSAQRPLNPELAAEFLLSSAKQTLNYKT